MTILSLGKDLYQSNGPFTSLYSLEQVCIKARLHADSQPIQEQANLIWLLRSILFIVQKQDCDAGELSVANLSGKGRGGKGLLDLHLMKKGMLSWFRTEVHDESLIGVLDKVLSTHDAELQHYGTPIMEVDQSWISLQTVAQKAFLDLVHHTVYRTKYDWILKMYVKAGRTVADVMDHAEMKQAWKDVLELRDNETAPATEEPPAASTKVKPQTTSEPAPVWRVAKGTMRPTGEYAEVNGEEDEKVAEAEEDAQGDVRAGVKLISTDGLTHSQLVAEIKHAPLNEKRGNVKSGFVMIIVDPKLCGEGVTTAASKIVNLRDDHLKRTISAVLEARGSAKHISAGDVLVLFDGARYDHKRLASLIVDDESATIPTVKRELSIILTEDFLLYQTPNLNKHTKKESAERSADQSLTRGMMTVAQRETIYFHTAAAHQPALKKRKNAVFEGTTCGDHLYGVSLPTAFMTWNLSFKDKKQTHGNARIGISTPKKEGAEGASTKRRRHDDDIEPHSFWSRHPDVYTELLHRMAVVAVIDATCNDGMLATVCLATATPYLGLCFTLRHKELLNQYLDGWRYEQFTNESSKLLYNATVAATLDQMKPKATKQKPNIPEPDTPKPDTPKPKTPTPNTVNREAGVGGAPMPTPNAPNSKTHKAIAAAQVDETSPASSEVSDSEGCGEE